MAESHIFEVELPEGHIVEVEAPETTDHEVIRRRVYQEVLKNPELSPNIAKQQGYGYKSPTSGTPTPKTTYDDPTFSGPVPQKDKSAESFLGPMLGGVGPEALGQRILGAASTVSSILPGGSTPRKDAVLPTLTPEQEIGSKVATVAPMVEAGVGLAGKAAAVRNPALQVERALAPTSAEAKAVAAQAAPEAVARGTVPQGMMQTSKDRWILENKKLAEAKLEAAEKNIPKGVTISRSPILSQIDSAIDELRIPGRVEQTPDVTQLGKSQYGTWETQTTPGQTIQHTVTGNPAGIEALLDVRKQLAKLPESVPFENVRKLRQQLDKAIADHAGWQEASSTADKAGLRASRQAVQSIRDSLKGISPELDEANAAYHNANQMAQVVKTRRAELRGFDTAGAAERAGLPPASKPSFGSRVARYAVPGAIGAGSAGSLYKLHKILGGE